MLRIVVERAGDLLVDEVFRKSLISIGRNSDADVVLDDSTVSALHLVIKADPQGNGFRFFDQGWNGTVQNGQKVLQGHFGFPVVLQISDYDVTLIPVARSGTEEVESFPFVRSKKHTQVKKNLPTLVDATPPLARAELRSLSGDCEPAIIVVSQRMLIGRSSDCAVRSERANVSRHHLEVYPENQGFSVRRLSDRNGVEINGRRLEPLEEAKLASGDIISFSGHQLMFMIPGQEIPLDLTTIVEASPNTDLAVYERPCPQEGIVALDVVGFLGAKTCLKFETAIAQRIVPGSRVLLDLGYLVGIDGIGISKLACLIEEASATGSRIHFIRVPPRVSDVLAKSPLIAVLAKHISRSEMSGIRQFNSSEGIS